MAGNGSLLVVDDDRDIREMARLLLEVSGYRVATATDGLDAWQRIERGEVPALILLDLMMPRMDGEQFLQALRASGRSNIPVVVISGHAAATAKARELGADGWLCKPIELDDLLAVVERFVNGSGASAGPGSPAR